MANTRKIIAEPLKVGFVCIDSYNEKCFEGRVFYPAFETELKFGNAMQMLGVMANAISDLGYAEEYCKMRSFAPNQAGRPSDRGASTAVQPKGLLATFKIKVIFMQNATWQGIISWEESGEEQNFRSVLEMLNLMDSALSSCK